MQDHPDHVFVEQGQASSSIGHHLDQPVCGIGSQEVDHRQVICCLNLAKKNKRVSNLNHYACEHC
jgi:hypothetical protein